MNVGRLQTRHRTEDRRPRLSGKSDILAVDRRRRDNELEDYFP